MPKVSPIQSDFSAGEFSPLTQGRVDADRYKKGLAKCQNYVPTLQGPIVRLPGTYNVASGGGRLIPFEFSNTQAYIIEAGNFVFNFYMNNGQIVSGGFPYQISTPYASTDLTELQFVQSADTLYLVHPSYAPRKLTRTGHTAWTLTTISFSDGPYDKILVGTGGFGGTTHKGLSLSAASGSITVTLQANSVPDVNGGSGFLSTDVGRLIRVKDNGTAGWGSLVITAFTDSTHVTAAWVLGSGFSTPNEVTFRMGIWSDTTGYPAAVSFHEDRLVFAGSAKFPQRIDGSVTSDYENFQPSDLAGTTAPSDSYAFDLNSSDVNVIEWLASDEKGLLAGTLSNEWSVLPADPNSALSAVNVSAKKVNSFGSASVQPAQAGKSTLYIQRGGKKLRELIYAFDADGYKSIDLTEIAEHMTGTGVKQIAFQKTPHPIVWVLRNDGVLAGMTYDRDSDNLRVGWHKHVFGGYNQDSGAVAPGATRTPAQVQSIAVIPSADGTRQELWMTVSRRVGGSTLSTVEYMNKFFEETDDQEDAFFVDCGLSYNVSGTIESAGTVSAEARLNMTAHPFANGDTIRIEDAPWSVFNNKYFKVVLPIAADYFTIHTEDDFPVNISGMPGGFGIGTARKVVTSVSGLSYLNGETVSILADGAVQPSQVVSSGTIAISPRAARIHVGLPYLSDAQMLRIEAGAADGTATGKVRRTNRVAFLLFQTLGFKIGMSFDKLFPVTFRTASDLIGKAVPLYSGLIHEMLEAPYDTENQICWRQDDPLPGTILAVMPQMVTQDRG